MDLPTLIQLLVLVTAVCAGVIVPNERDVISSTLCANMAPTTVTVVSTQNPSQVETVTEIQTTTVTEQPGTVTVALQGPAAILSSLNSAFSVESQQLEINSQLAPVNPRTSTRPPPPPSATRFTRTIVVPVVEATKTTSTANVYFIGDSDGTTSWLTDLIPHESMTIGTTTVTLSPLPSSSTGRSTSMVTIMTSRRDSMSSARENVLHDQDQGSNSTAPAPVTPIRSGWLMNGTGLDTLSPITIVTVRSSAFLNTTAPISQTLPSDAYGSPVNITFPIADYKHRKRAVEDNRRKAVCEWVTATMRGTPVSWPNNWDGSKTVDCATVVPLGATLQAPATLSPTLATITVTVPATSSTEQAPVSSSANPTETIVPSATSATPTETIVPSATSATPTETIVPTSATTQTPPAATSCGVTGDFTLDFDTLPQFFPPDNDTAPFPPIFNPYRHLFFSSGWAYVPPPTIPVSPQNGSHLAIYVPTASETNSSVSQSPHAGDVPPGSFGAGPRAYNDAYWFDADTLYVFCDNGATDPTVICEVVVTGYRWDTATESEIVVLTQRFIHPPCPGFVDCQTREIFLDKKFRGLSSLSLYTVVQGKQKIFFMDTVELSWWNNTCEAGLTRARQL